MGLLYLSSIRRIGLRRLLHLDKLRNKSDRLRVNYTARLAFSFRLVASCFAAEAAYKAWWYATSADRVPFFANDVLSDVLACSLEMASWMYRSAIYLLLALGGNSSSGTEEGTETRGRRHGEAWEAYCDTCQRFLVDRLVEGACPTEGCTNKAARGDQCDNCSHMLIPTELIDPKCKVCKNTPHIRETDHLFLDLPLLEDKLVNYINDTSVAGMWSQNAIQATNAWLKEGLKSRCITRGLKWGVPVPIGKYKDKGTTNGLSLSD